MKKFLAILLALCMMLSLSVTAFAAEYNDTNGHWGEAAIDRWSEYEVVRGKGNGIFDPDGNMKRGEAAQVFANLLKLTEKADLSEYTDVGLGKWYDDAIAKCVKAGILNGVGGGLMDPEGTITREMFFVMFARALNIQPAGKAEVNITDAANASDWASGYIIALVNKGYVKGVSATSDGVTVAPKLKINRASVMSLLDQTIDTYVNTADAVVAGDGFVLIVADNAKVSLKNGTGKAEVFVFGKNVVITNAPAGTTVTTSDEATGTKVNGKTQGKDTTIVVEETKPAPYTPPTPVHEHTYAAEWSKDADWHWHAATCEHSSEVSGKAAHTFVWQADKEVCSVCSYEKVKAVKFELDVTSNATVSMKVFDDYSFVIAVPAANVSATSVSAKVSMTDVASLDVTGTKTAEFSLDTGLSGDPALTSWLGNAWTFGGEGKSATLNVNIADKPVIYTITGSADANGAEPITETAYIYGTPNTIAAARTAWAELTDHVTTAENVGDDSYVSIAGNSFLALGEDKLVMEDATEDLDLFKGTWSKDGLEGRIRDAVKLVDYAGEYDAVAVVGAGTELALGSSKATLDDNCVVTVNGFAEADVLSALTNLQGANGLQNIVKTLVEEINNAMGDIQGKTLTVNFNFDEGEDHSHAWDDGVCTECGATQDDAMKFELAVESGESTVDMTVFDDYSFIINVPNANVDAASATATVKMQNVASLGVGEERSHSITVNTGIDGHKNIALGTYLSNAWELSQKTTTVNINIDGEACTYVITGNEAEVNAATGKGADAVLYGKPDDIAATRAAWAKLAGYVTTEENGSDDSYVSIAGDSYIAIGEKRLVMETNSALELFKGEWSKDTLESQIRDAVKLVDNTGANNQCEIRVGMGTVLALGNSKATLSPKQVYEYCKITVNGVDEGAAVLSALTDLQNATGLQNIVKTLVEEINNAMGAVCGENINVTISFPQNEPPM